MSTEIQILMFMAIMAAGAWGLKQSREKDRKNEKKYMERYAMIRATIESHEVCEQNFRYILHLLDNLRGMKWKDHRRSNELRDSFNDKFQEYIEKQDAEMFR